MTKTAFYAGSFDPITNGHLDILRQSLALFDKVVVAIGIHAGKVPFFTYEERRELLQQVVSEAGLDVANVEVISFDNLVVDAARNAGAVALVRGLRDGTDLDYEMQLAGMNGAMEPQLQTIFFPATPEVRPITATLVRQIAKMGGDVSSFVPPSVKQALDDKTKQAN